MLNVKNNPDSERTSISAFSWAVKFFINTNPSEVLFVISSPFGKPIPLSKTFNISIESDFLKNLTVMVPLFFSGNAYLYAFVMSSFIIREINLVI